MRTLDEVDTQLIEFFLHNFGQTAAFDIRMTSNPPLQEAWKGEENEQMWVFDVLPTLAPGDEWTQLMGSAPEHFNNGLPLKYDINVEWRDSSNKLLTAKYVLDLDAHRNRNKLVQKSIHHLVKTTQETNKNLAAIHKTLKSIEKS